VGRGWLGWGYAPLLPVGFPPVKFKFDRLYGNFDDFLGFRAKRIVRFSANRHIAWIKGDFDDLT